MDVFNNTPSPIPSSISTTFVQFSLPPLSLSLLLPFLNKSSSPPHLS